MRQSTGRWAGKRQPRTLRKTLANCPPQTAATSVPSRTPSIEPRRRQESEVAAMTRKTSMPAQVAEGAAPAPDDADDETFGRQDRQTREDHARNAHAVEDRADEDRRKLLEVGGGCDEGRERIGRVEEEAEDEADRNLLDELHEKP